MIRGSSCILNVGPITFVRRKKNVLDRVRIPDHRAELDHLEVASVQIRLAAGQTGLVTHQMMRMTATMVKEAMERNDQYQC